jgi:hypothetical protein
LLDGKNISSIGIYTDSSCQSGQIGNNNIKSVTTYVSDNATGKSNINVYTDFYTNTGSGVPTILTGGSIPTITFNPNNTTAQNCYIDFKTSGLGLPTFDSRIIGTSGSGTSLSGNGNLNIDTGILTIQANTVLQGTIQLNNAATTATKTATGKYISFIDSTGTTVYVPTYA